MDPYLEKRQREEAEIRRQIDAQIAAGFDVKPTPAEKKKVEEFFVPEPPVGDFIKMPSGLYVPPSAFGPDSNIFNAMIDATPTNYTATKNDNEHFQEQIYGYPVIKTDAKTLMDSLKYVAAKMFGPFEPCDCPHCQAEKRDVADAAVLRGYHGKRYEYVYSDVLKMHVRIGEPMKAKSHE